MIDRQNMLGAIIAGGQATRMNKQNKALKTLAGKPLAEHIAFRLCQQVDSFIFNANRDKELFSAIGMRVSGQDIAIVSDVDELGAGPLAGILQSLLHLEITHHSHLVSVAGDTPFFPEDLVSRLAQKAPDDETIVIARSDGFPQPVFGLWPSALTSDLNTWLSAGNSNKVMAWVRTHPHCFVDFEATRERDPFFNINTPEDLALAEQVVAEENA